MKNVVTVKAHPETGELITPSQNNKKTGSIRLEQVSFKFSPSGFMNEVRRVGFMHAELPALNSFLKTFGVSKDGDTIEGKLFVHETVEGPWYEDQDPKTAGKDGEVLVDGDENPIYRKVFFVPAEQVDQYQDILVPHVNEIEYTPEDDEAAEEALDSGAGKPVARKGKK